ncbi:spore germination protein [Psychrobacillus sp. OK028]|uniref:Ger(x)C family spore germination protein n=1 Tax=Psychrobacillus sp. OK028 TaxID=1884359 RepID=UPI00088617ED|nr:Ger(x)C family spore germination protein [Psychrobacillus sp. OK028]SDN10572.1 spore germination protein [Psychrobacillus sp. OK028]
MKTLSFYIILLFIVSLLAGCVQTNILDKVGLVTLVGYDVGTEEKISTTAVVREVNPEFQSNVQVITTENKTSKGNRMKTNRKLSKKIMVGQMRVILLSEELAKDNIHHYIETNLENATVSNSLYLAVVEGQMAPLLEYKYNNIEDVGQHIYRLLQQNIEQEHMISSTLHEIAHDMYMAGDDIAMPIIKKDEELVGIAGIALFKEDKMVGRLSAEDSFFVKLIRDNFKSGIYETVLQKDNVPSDLLKNKPNEISLAFDAIRSKRDIKLVNPTTPEFDLNLKVKAQILEIVPDVNMDDPKKVAKLEKAISKNLTSDIIRIIDYGKSIESDVFGFGEKYRSSVRGSNLTKEKWHELYKNMKVNVKVDFVIMRNGVFE